MAQTKLGFSRLSIPQKIQLVRNIIKLMTGNANFATPNPTLAAIILAVNNLETAFEAASDGGKAKKAFMYTLENTLHKLMVQLAAYIQETSGGDETIILSSGMQVRAGRTPSPLVDAPQALKPVTGANEGEVLLKWKPVAKAKAYLLQQSPDAVTAWTNAGTSTKSSASVTGLVSGSKTWFRVCAIGAKGNGPWSDPARGMAG